MRTCCQTTEYGRHTKIELKKQEEFYHGKELQQYKQFKQKHKRKERFLFILCGDSEQEQKCQQKQHKYVKQQELRKNIRCI